MESEFLLRAEEAEKWKSNFPDSNPDNNLSETSNFKMGFIIDCKKTQSSSPTVCEQFHTETMWNIAETVIDCIDKEGLWDES